MAPGSLSGAGGPPVSGNAVSWSELHEPKWMADLERCRRFDEFNNEYTTSIVIKEGAFAKVYRTEKRDRKSGESPVVLAAKLCTAKAVSDINIWASELHIHNIIKMHPNIITLFDAFIKCENGNPSASGILFVLELGMKDLKSHIRYYGRVADAEKAHWTSGPHCSKRLAPSMSDRGGCRN